MLKQPKLDGVDVEALHRLLHPTLLPWDVEGAHEASQTLKRVNTLLPEARAFKFAASQAPRFYQEVRTLHARSRYPIDMSSFLQGPTHHHTPSHIGAHRPHTTTHTATHITAHTTTHTHQLPT